MKITEEIKKSANMLYKIARKLDKLARENDYHELEASVDAKLNTLILLLNAYTCILKVEYGLAKKAGEPKEAITR